MRKTIALIGLLLATVSWFGFAADKPEPAGFGTLTVESMTQGQLLWLKGRVAEASYTFTDQNRASCKVKIPVAIGGMSEPDIGISNTPGLTIVVLSQQLNDALIQGKPISSEDWRFTTQLNSEGDGLIVSGIKPNEHFVLNSRKRWISWFMSEKPVATCL